MSKFQLKVNQRNNEEEIIINKRTKLMDCDEETVGFDLVKLEGENNDNLQITALQYICHLSTGKQVSVAGRGTFQKSPDSVTVKGKEISKQEVIHTDESASVRMVFGRWTFPR